MSNKKTRTNVNTAWHVVRGKNAPGILFEISLNRPVIRIKRGRFFEFVDLSKYGITYSEKINKETNERQG